MKMYIKKYSKNKVIVYSETTNQSILSDLMTLFVVICLVGLDLLLSIYVNHSVVFDIMVVIIFFTYMSSFRGTKQEIKTKDELENELKELF